MPLLDVIKGSFTSGELSPLAWLRPDVDRYRHGAAQLENWIVLLQGAVTRRPGLRYVATVKYPARLTLVKAFEPSTTDAYILEVGHEYIRFFKNGAQIRSGGVPVEVATPYQESELRQIRTAQSNDIMILVHPTHATQRLSRLSDTSWILSEVSYSPPPTFEAGEQPQATLTLSALTGTITITASSSVFLAADQQRQITQGVGRAVVTAVTSGTQVTASVRDAFTSLTATPGAWTLTGSPVAQCKPTVTGPLGAQCTLTLRAIQDTATELLTNGDFATGDLTGWSDLSGPLLAAGVTDGGLHQELTLKDSTAHFLSAGVESTQRLSNVTDGSVGTVNTVSDTVIGMADKLTGGTNDVWNTGDQYEVRATGSARVSGQSCLLAGGTAGIGWIEQAISSVAGVTYRVTFDVSDAPLAAQVGSASQGSQLLSEASYPLGAQALIFTATGTTSYVQFRNNQPTVGKLGSVSAKQYSIAGFRAGDVGAYLVLNQGILHVTSLSNATQAVGEVVKELSTDVAAAAGAWTMERMAWSDTLGWPSTLVFYEGRLYFASSTRFPQTLWGSVIDDFFNFALGPKDDDSVQFTLIDSGGNITLNRIRWLMPAENLLVGTTHGEYRLVGSGDDPLTPRLIPRVRIQSTFGSDSVQPLKVGSAILFTQRQGSKIREMAFDAVTRTTFVARDLTVLSSHLLDKDRLLDLAYQPEPLSVVWGVRADGTLLGLTYDQSEQIVAWHRHTTPSGVVLSVATIPHPTANAHQTWVTAARQFGTRETQMIEYFDAEAEMALPTPVMVINPVSQEPELLRTWRGLTVDSGVVYSGAPTATLTGLEHLEGATVQVVGDGAVIPSQVVHGGQVQLPQAVRTAFVGLGYVARGRTLPLEAALRGTTAQRSRKRWVEVAARVYQTAGLIVQGQRIPFRAPGMPQDQGVPPQSLDVRIVSLGWDRQGAITFSADQPLPCTLVGLVGVLDVEAEPQLFQTGKNVLATSANPFMVGG